MRQALELWEQRLAAIIEDNEVATIVPPLRAADE
jgi:hypothetical protein